MINYVKYIEKGNLEGLQKALDKKVKDDFRNHPENKVSVEKIKKYNNIIKENYKCN